MTRKKPADVAGAAPAAPAVTESPVTPPVDLPPVDPADEAGLTSAEYSTAFSPRNVAIGLAIVAGLLAFAASRHRLRRRAEPDDVIDLDV